MNVRFPNKAIVSKTEAASPDTSVDLLECLQTGGSRNPSHSRATTGGCFIGTPERVRLLTPGAKRDNRQPVDYL